MNIVKPSSCQHIFLLGAGASVPAGVPAAYAMTRDMVDHLQGRLGDQVARLLGQVVGTIIQQSSLYGGNPFGAVNIEDVFNAVDLLSERYRIDVAPFIRDDHPLIRQVNSIAEQCPLPHFDTCHELKRKLRTELVRLTWLQDAQKVQYLKFIAELAAQQPGMCIATLNYDNTIELMAESAAVPCEIGLNDWFTNDCFTSAAMGITLLKLHGSIDWTWDHTLPQIGNAVPNRLVRQATSVDLSNPRYDPAVIFGHHNKLTAHGPFLDLLTAFRKELAAANKLVVAGYSFSDTHINEYIQRWLNTSIKHSLCVVDPGVDSSEAVIEKLLRADDRYDDEWWSLNGRGIASFAQYLEGRVHVIQKSIAEAEDELLIWLSN